MKVILIGLAAWFFLGGVAWGQGGAAELARAVRLSEEVDSLRAYRDFENAAMKSWEIARICEKILGPDHENTYKAWEDVAYFSSQKKINNLFYLSQIKEIDRLVSTGKIIANQDHFIKSATFFWLYFFKVYSPSKGAMLSTHFEKYYEKYLLVDDLYLLEKLLDCYKLIASNKNTDLYNKILDAFAKRTSELALHKTKFESEIYALNEEIILLIYFIDNEQYKRAYSVLNRLYQQNVVQAAFGYKYILDNLIMLRDLSLRLNDYLDSIEQDSLKTYLYLIDSIHIDYANKYLDKVIKIAKEKDKNEYMKNLYHSSSYLESVSISLALVEDLLKRGKKNDKAKAIKEIYLSLLENKIYSPRLNYYFSHDYLHNELSDKDWPAFGFFFDQRNLNPFLNLLYYNDLSKILQLSAVKAFSEQDSVWALMNEVNELTIKSDHMAIRFFSLIDQLMEFLVSNEKNETKNQAALPANLIKLADELTNYYLLLGQYLLRYKSITDQFDNSWRNRLIANIDSKQINKYSALKRINDPKSQTLILYSSTRIGFPHNYLIYQAPNSQPKAIEYNFDASFFRENIYRGKTLYKSFTSVNQINSNEKKTTYFDSYFFIDSAYVAPIRSAIPPTEYKYVLALFSGGHNQFQTLNHNIFLTDTSCLRKVRDLEFDEGFWSHPLTKECFSRKTWAYHNMPVYLASIVDRAAVHEQIGIKPNKQPGPIAADLKIRLVCPLRSTLQFASIDRPKTVRDFGNSDFFQLVDNPTSAYELHFVDDEFQNIKRSFANKTVAYFVDTSLYREELIKVLCQPADILHLASHSWQDKTGFSSFYLLARPKAGSILIDNLISEFEIGELPIKAKLVVLSSCESAVNRYSEVAGPRGLATAFLRAGAEMVLGSLWKVDDRAAAEFMKHFYTGLARDFDPSLPVERVRQACQYAVHQLVESDEFCHPFYWAGWQLWVR